MAAALARPLAAGIVNRCRSLLIPRARRCEERAGRRARPAYLAPGRLASACKFLLISRADAPAVAVALATPAATGIVNACRSLLIRRFAAALAVLTILVAPALAKVERVEITSREPFASGTSFGAAGAYEKLRGRAFFALDPAAAANAAIADLKLAPRRADGRVVFTADFLMLRPSEPARGNATLLYEVNNRGRIAMLRQLDEATFNNDPATPADAGNGFLFRQGFTLLWSAWATDVATTPGDKLLLLQAPIATENGQPITGPVAYDLIVDAPALSARFTGIAGTAYPFATPGAPDAALTERERPEGERRPIARAAWSFVADRKSVV